MNIKAILLGALFGASLHAQTFLIDDFDTGDFAESGSALFSQTLDSANVLGEVRNVRLYFDSGSDIAVSGGAFSFNKTDDSVAWLRYGNHDNTAPSEDLNLDLSDGIFSIAVASMTAPFTVNVEVRQGANYASKSVVVQNTGTLIMDATEFTGGTISDWSDIDGIQLGFGGSLHSDFAISGFSGEANVVPEPSTYAALFGCGLLLFAGYRRRFTLLPSRYFQSQTL